VIKAVAEVETRAVQDGRDIVSLRRPIVWCPATK